MKEIIRIELPLRIGELITQDMIDEIRFMKDHKEIRIKIIDNKLFEKSYKEDSIQIVMK